MIELPNIETIKIPLNPSREWIWYRILISVDYHLLKIPTALQWALINILVNIDTFSEELTTEKVATKLAVEKTIIEEGLNNLLDEKLVSLQPRKRSDVLQNYSLHENIKEFTIYELIPHARDNKKFILYYDYKDERLFQYQSVEKADIESDEEVENSLFELVLLAIIEEIWQDLENNPHSLVGEIQYNKILQHRLIKDLRSIKIENIHLNFI